MDKEHHQKTVTSRKTKTLLATRVNDLPESVTEQAKALYFINCPENQILKIVDGIKKEELDYLIKGRDGTGSSESCWMRIKRENHDATVTAASLALMPAAQHNIAICNAILKHGLEGLLKDVKSGEKKLSSRELREISEVFANIDKITRLEQGDPTEIYEMAGLTAEQAREILKEDPFAFGIVDADARVITEE